MQIAITLLGGEGNDTIDGKGSQHSHSYVDGGNGINKITFAGHYSTIKVGNGDELGNGSTIEADGTDFIMSEMSIIGGTGNDRITYATKKSTIFGGAGNDIIFSNYTNSSLNYIDGGKGNDLISLSASDNTIISGEGNDTISLSSSAKNNVIVYNSGDGNDIIYGLDENDTLSITGGMYLRQNVENDVLLTVGNEIITL